MDDELVDFLMGVFSSFREMKTSKVKRRVKEAGFDDSTVREHLRALEREDVIESEYTKDVHGTYERLWRYLN